MGFERKCQASFFCPVEPVFFFVLLELGSGKMKSNSNKIFSEFIFFFSESVFT